MVDASRRSGKRGGVTRRIGRLLTAGTLAAAAVVPAVAISPAGPVAALDPVVTTKYTPVGPLRLADTRETDCGCTRLDDHTIRVAIAGREGIASPISAVAVTVTVVAGPLPGFVTAYPAGTQRPPTSTVNVLGNGIAANSAIVPVGAGGELDLYANVAADVVVDVTGVFTVAATAAAGRFQAVSPARLFDSRGGDGTRLLPGATATLALPGGVPSDATAVAVNVTSVQEFGPGYVTGYAAGATPADTSFVNPDGTGAARAATVILPVSALGFTLRTTSGGHLVVDLVGWFTGASAPESTVGLFVPVDPQRLLDTRSAGPRLWPGGTREIASPYPDAGALVTNLTIDRSDAEGYVAAYPAGTPPPNTSSLNAPGREATVANMAITGTSTRGTAYYSNWGTDLIVDVTGYFLGAPVAADLPEPPNVMPHHRVLMVGDSTLGALVYVTGTKRALLGFDTYLDAANCRRLVNQGCKSDYTTIAPSTVVEAILGAPGNYDVVVVKAGYNDPLSPFAPAVDAIVKAARAKGARQVLWLTYSNSDSQLEYLLERDNAILSDLAGSVDYPDLIAVDWRNFAPPSTGWYVADRHHLNVIGAWATADYLARWIAHLEHRPCPMPWTVGGPIDDPCPSPDDYAAITGTVPSLKALYGF